MGFMPQNKYFVLPVVQNGVNFEVFGTYKNQMAN